MSYARVSSPRATLAGLGLCALALVTMSCGGKHVTLPAGPGTPFPDSVAAYAEATGDCRGAQTVSASLSLSGRAGSTKLAARIDAGFAAPARLRLEGYPRIAFGGRPFFILVANGTDTTLVLTRDNRVLRGAAPSAIIEALTGIALDPDELRTLTAGCGVAAGQAADGRSFDGGWASVQTGPATIFLRRIENHWRVAGARRGSLQVVYSDFNGTRPASVRLHTTQGAGVVATDLSIHISQFETNATLGPGVFSVDVPKDAVPLTLDELQRAGPLGGATEKTKSGAGGGEA
jgi:hypothetical protein